MLSEDFLSAQSCSRGLHVLLYLTRMPGGWHYYFPYFTRGTMRVNSVAWMHAAESWGRVAPHLLSFPECSAGGGSSAGKWFAGRRLQGAAIVKVCNTLATSTSPGGPLRRADTVGRERLGTSPVGKRIGAWRQLKLRQRQMSLPCLNNFPELCTHRRGRKLLCSVRHAN